MTFLARLSDAIDWFNERIGRKVWWLSLALVLVQFAIVLLRYVFGTTSIMMQESVIYLHAALFMTGAAYTLLHDGHVRVDVFYSETSPRARAWIDLIGAAIAVLPFCALVLWISWTFVGESWRMREGAMSVGGIPAVYLLKTLIPVFAGLLLLQGVSMMCRAALVIAGATPDGAGRAGRDGPA